MKFEVSTDYLAPIELDRYEHATIILPTGHRVVRVAEPGVARTTDGKVIWKTKRKALEA